ncbi:MAG TPA: pyruvate ferredoxin oxidoreductase [Coriobacteriia bacterium]|nr:MAG: 2-oxoacid:ferredoxin oxidoreductase, gamma subunit [Actinobacteria bacterium 66_15]HAL30717.1 pyruvate ferredoxin oxidoreductase [Coriobacteriia bacterium]
MMTTVVLAGVGGQGTILAGDVLAKVAVAEGMDVKLSEVHGMAQRGGSVETFVRFGETVFAPVVDPGMADHLIAFEMTEAARTLTYLRPGGTLVVNRRTVDSLPVLIGDMPAPEGLEEALVGEGAIFLDAEALACEAGSPRSANIVLMGAASYALPFEVPTWERVISDRVPPKTVEANLRAFHLGRDACAEGVCSL